MKPIFAILITFLFVTAFQFPQTENESGKISAIVDPSVRSRIDASLKSFVDSGKVSGVSALVFEKGKEVYYNAFGYADREAQIPMDRHTIVRIYSMTKPVVGVALMKLYSRLIDHAR